MKSSYGLQQPLNRMKLFSPILIISLLAGLVANYSGAQAIGRQEEELAEMLRIFPRSEPWEKWLNQSHALPPDFDAMPSIPFLPDPLRFANGTEVRKEDWPKRRQELLGLFERYVIGSVPPSAGDLPPPRIAPRAGTGAPCGEGRLRVGAWAAIRCIDYLTNLPTVDPAKIALTGHSRNGKTSLIGAAIDQRIAAVISSSSGAGGACSYRFFSESQFGEGIELITRAFPDWLHPRLRFFVGRENKLPVDQPELIACIAPRPCLISTALNDSVESVWAIEQTYYSAHRVFELLGKGDELSLRYRPGSHETGAEDIEAYLDWLDKVFGGARLEFA